MAAQVLSISSTRLSAGLWARRVEEIDVVDICTPPALHATMIVEAMQAGKHVVCEKPFCNSATKPHPTSPTLTFAIAALLPGRVHLTAYGLARKPTVLRESSVRNSSARSAMAQSHPGADVPFAASPEKYD